MIGKFTGHKFTSLQQDKKNPGDVLITQRKDEGNCGIHQGNMQLGLNKKEKTEMMIEWQMVTDKKG